jgi:hypothetical protein
LADEIETAPDKKNSSEGGYRQSFNQHGWIRLFLHDLTATKTTIHLLHLLLDA